PAGAQSGVANGEEVVLQHGVFRRKSDGVIAGSGLTMLRGLQNLVKWGCPLGLASMAASDNPARLFKLNIGVMEKGKLAAFVVLDKGLNLQCALLN
ncbi:MAG: amidohydrolase family protein, partial [Elusimicrobiota bacterium]|nr:amidohydrolase family protein [Elusimicrobiota bacterium]